MRKSFSSSFFYFSSTRRARYATRVFGAAFVALTVFAVLAIVFPQIIA